MTHESHSEPQPEPQQISKGAYYMKLMKIASTQLNILNIYDNDLEMRNKRDVEYDEALSADGDGKDSRNMISLIYGFDEDIQLHRERLSPGLEDKCPDLRDNFAKLQKYKREIRTPEI
jgi:hypothetical protein